MALKVLLVDDEPLARLRLRSLLQGLREPATEVIGEAGDAVQALAALNAGPCDLVLLDIHLPGQGGMQLAATLRGLAQPPAVVFVSAYAEHALKAFDVDAVDYLTKPVRPERLRAALERVLRVVQRQSAPMSAAPASAGAAAADTAEAAGGPGPALLISDRGRLLRLPLAELLYLKAEQKYVTLRSTTRELRVDESLSELEPRLGPGFVRVHRNAIVSRQAVRALELRAASVPDPEDSGGWAVCVAPIGEWLAVSRRQVAAVRAALAQPPPR